MHFFVWKWEKLREEFEDVKGDSFMLCSAEGGG